MARAILLARAEEERLARQAVMERRLLRQESRPLQLPDNLFIGLYRLSKRQFVELCQELKQFLPDQRRLSGILPEIKILAAIAFYADGGYQKKVGALYHLGLSQTSICLCIKEVTQALNSPSILRKYIRFPHTVREREEVALGFMDKFGFPGVVGCIDGTHVAIIRPTDREEDFYNRKGYHSLNVMAICDSNLVITHVDASFGGAAHDSHVWNCSQVKVLMESLHEQNEACWLLGDSGYAQRGWMMQPILQAAPNSPEEYYTALHCRTRNVVERCFGVLKTRWRCLLAHRVLHYAPIKAGQIVNACVVLHNFIRDPNLRIDQEVLVQDLARQPPPAPAVEEASDHGRSAVVARLWNSRPNR